MREYDRKSESTSDNDHLDPRLVWLLPLKSLDEDAKWIKLADIAGLSLLQEQRAFVGEPLHMVLAGMEDPSRFPYVIEVNGVVVGVLTLQSGAAQLAGWGDDDSAWLLRGFAIDAAYQHRGFGRMAAARAVEEARNLTAAMAGREAGVVLSVNERNAGGVVAYGKAGFEDVGRYLGGDSGPQRVMFKAFAEPSSTVVDGHPGVIYR